ncbi:hypothetical protein FACS1894184_04630 [Clostridia bacterium]|nr:hypothetical protein FACS1894184_04630 [Clostridia bacterium]
MNSYLNDTHYLRGYRELAQYLNIGIETARLMMLEPEFPVITISPRMRIIKIAALEEWLHTNKELD